MFGKVHNKIVSCDVWKEIMGDKLDVFSDSFDPAEAIYNPDFLFPDPDAPLCDNVETFVKRYEQGGVKPKPKAVKKTIDVASITYLKIRKY